MANVEKFYLPPVFRVIEANTLKSGNPMGLKSSDCASWASDLNISKSADVLLYTGCEYQMLPYVEALLGILKTVKFEDSAISLFSGLQSVSQKVGLDIAKTYANVSRQQKEAFNKPLRMAALTLRKLGVEFSYWNDELYSGALLYEYGLFQSFQQHAKKVWAHFKERDAETKTLVVLSPHAGEIFKEIYPTMFADFHLNILTYPEFLLDAIRKSGRTLSFSTPTAVTLHDPCRLARSLDITEQPREILQSIRGLDLKEAANNRRRTICCGAPSETVFPELSEFLAAKRIDELCDTGAEAVVTLCPYCYASLRRALKSTARQIKVADLSEVVYDALGGA